MFLWTMVLLMRKRVNETGQDGLTIEESSTSNGIADADGVQAREVETCQDELTIEESSMGNGTADAGAMWKLWKQ